MKRLDVGRPVHVQVHQLVESIQKAEIRLMAQIASEDVKIFYQVLGRCQSVRIDGQAVQISGDDTGTVEVDGSGPFATQQIGRKRDSSFLQVGQRSELEPENVVVGGAVEHGHDGVDGDQFADDVQPERGIVAAVTRRIIFRARQNGFVVDDGRTDETPFDGGARQCKSQLKMNWKLISR